MKTLVVVALVLFVFAPHADAGVPDPGKTALVPWDMYGQAFMSPGFGGDSLLVMVRDSSNALLPGVTVEVDVSACSTLCVDYPDGLTAVTDQFGMAIFDPHVGGLGVCDIIVRADGVVLRTYTLTTSADWYPGGPTSPADGVVNTMDLSYFSNFYPSPPNPYDVSADYNADGVVDEADFNIFSGCYAAWNLYSCDTDPCVVTPPGLDFGTVTLGEWKEKTFRIANIGTGSFMVDVSDTSSQFTVMSGGGSYYLGPDEWQMVTVRYEPTEVGTHSDTIQTGELNCLDVACTGMGQLPAVCVVEPTAIDFGTLYVGSHQDTTFIITNVGDGTLVGTVSESYNYYSIVSGGGPYSLSAGETLRVTVRFEPQIDGPHVCVVETENVLCDDVYFTGFADFPPPECVVDPTSINFDTLLVGNTRDTTFIITNIGGGTVNGTVSEVCDHYSIVAGSGPYSLELADTQTVTVRFEPTAGGEHLCTVDTGDPGCVDVSLSGVGEELPACAVSPDTVDCGVVYVGSLLDTTFSITNTGGGLLSGTVGESCDHYTIVSPDTVYDLAGGDTVFITVRFEPTATGTHDCTVETGHTLCDDVFFTGVGETPPACLVQPENLDFGPVALGNSKDLVFAVVNTGGGLLDGSISEVCPDYSIVSGGGGYSLAASETLKVTVRFEPTSEGASACTIETGQSLCADVYSSGFGASEPVILSITDVGNDQGRNVRIRWERCSYDAAGDTVDIVSYGIYRRQDLYMHSVESGSTPARKDAAADRSPQLDGWDPVGTVAARGDQFYQFIAPTLCDSTISHGMCWSAFMVSAQTPDPLVYYDSQPDSGYSVDNLAPYVPAGLSVAYISGVGNHLVWDPSPDEDFQYFKVYRGPDPDFAPAFGNLVEATTEPAWTDTSFATPAYYKISAVDFAGNESDATSSKTVTAAGGTGVPDEYALYQNVPNPFNPTTVIRFDVPSGGGDVSLRVYDVQGRLVRTLVDERHSPGQKTVAWNGKNDRGESVATGVYFYRLTASGFEMTRKMVLLQ